MAKQLKILASLNIPESTNQIQKDLQTIEKQLKPISVSLQINSDQIKSQTQQIQQQINSVTKTASSSVNIPINFKASAEEVKGQLAQLVAQIRKEAQGTVIDYKVNLSQDGNIDNILLKYKNAANQISDSIIKLQDMGDKLPDGTANLQWVESLKSVSQNIEQTIKQNEKLTESQQKQVNTIDELSVKMKLLQTQASTAGVSLNQENLSNFTNALNTKDIENASHYLSLARTEYQQLNAEMSKQLPQNAIDNMEQRAQKLSSTIDQITAKFSQVHLGNQSGFASQVDQVSVNVNQLKTNLDAFNNTKVGQDKVAAFNELNTSVSETKKQVDDLYKSQKALEQLQGVYGSFEGYLKTNPKVASQFKSQIADIQSYIKSLSQETDMTKLTSGLGDVRARISSIRGEAKAFGAEGRTLFGELGNDLKKLATWGIGTTILYGSLNEVKQLYTSINALDDQMVELRKVTDETETTYNEFYHTANDVAKSLGVTTESVISSTAAWAQMGYNIKDASDLAKDSEIFKNISENMDVTEATNTLISAMKAFKIDSNDALDGIISKVNEVNITCLPTWKRAA